MRRVEKSYIPINPRQNFTDLRSNILSLILDFANQMAILVDAIEGREEVSFLYRSQTVQKASVRAVRPLGLLFSRFGYLVASTGSRTLVSYRLDLLKDVKLFGSYFELKSDWNFKPWAGESFGIFHLF